MKPNPMMQSLFLNGFRGGKVDGISLMQVHPLDPYTLIHVHSSDTAVGRPRAAGIPLSASPQRSGRTKRKPAFTAEETRHHFAIEPLDKSGPFRPQPYLYTCVRCKWIFRLNDARGSIIALDGLGRHLPDPENAKRVLTFHRGPCPAFPAFEYLVADVQRESRLLSYVSRFVDVLRSITDPGRRRAHSHDERTAS